MRKPASERLTRLEALALYTRHAAWLAFAEQHRGQLRVGKQADLAVPQSAIYDDAGRQN